MGFDGSGGYNRVHNWVTDKNAAVKIRADRMDAEMDDMASAFGLCLLKDGQQDPTANLPMATKKHTGVAAASARTEYLDGASYQDGKFVWASVADPNGVSAISLTLNPTITFYTTGMRVGFIAVGDNASAVTIDIDGVSAAAGVKGKNEALVATDIVSGGAYWITYKGANGFQFGNPLEENPTFVTLMTTGLATLNNVLVSGSAVFASSLNVTGPANITGDATVSGKAVFASAVSVAGPFIHADNIYPASAGLANDIIKTDGAGALIWVKTGALWTNTGSIDLTSGSPTAVSLASSLVNVSEIEIHVEGFSTNTADQAALIQIGDPGGLELTGYSGSTRIVTASINSQSNNSTGFFATDQDTTDAAVTINFSITLRHMGSNVWVFNVTGAESTGVFDFVLSGQGIKTLTAALDRVTITTTGGVATIDNGTALVRTR